MKERQKKNLEKERRETIGEEHGGRLATGEQTTPKKEQKILQQAANRRNNHGKI